MIRNPMLYPFELRARSPARLTKPRTKLDIGLFCSQPHFNAGVTCGATSGCPCGIWRSPSASSLLALPLDDCPGTPVTNARIGASRRSRSALSSWMICARFAISLDGFWARCAPAARSPSPFPSPRRVYPIQCASSATLRRHATKTKPFGFL